MSHSFGWQIVAGSICVDKADARKKKVKSVVCCPPAADRWEDRPITTDFIPPQKRKAAFTVCATIYSKGSLVAEIEYR